MPSKKAFLLGVPALVLSSLIGWGTIIVHRGTGVTESHELHSAPAGRTPLTQAATARSREEPVFIWFEDVTDTSGITFSQTSGMTPAKEFPTAHGSGAAILDFNQDGRPDLYFANARCFPLDSSSEELHHVLYRQTSDGRYEDLSQTSGLAFRGFGQGIAVGDIDNDGYPDVYLANYGSAELLHNNGDGTYRSWTEAAALGDSRWGTSAGFLDYDNDGNLDLYVARYAKWTLESHVECGVFDPENPAKLLIRTYCNPKTQTPERHSLYYSQGDGRFLDVTESMGIARTDGRGQGVVTADLTGDGWTDLFIANDQNPNFLFVNTGKGRFEDLTSVSGASLSAQGKALAGMGVDAGDVNGDGLPELFVTNFYNEYNSLFENIGDKMFVDVSMSRGVAAGSMDKVGWGTALEDFDQDGALDILVVNGHVDDNLHEIGRDEPYREPSVVWRNLGGGSFRVCTDAGPYFSTEHVSRGASFGDLDNDGDVDVVITHKDERPTILHNESRSRLPTPPWQWVQYRLVGTRSNRDAIGTAIRLRTPSLEITRQVQGGRSYLSAHDLRITVGLRDALELDKAQIRWPGASWMELVKPALGQSHTLYEPAADGATANGD